MAERVVEYDEFGNPIATQTAATLDAVTARLKNNKLQGKILYEKGHYLLMNKPKVVPHRRYEDAIHYFYASHLAYRACSKWRHAGDSLCQMAKVLMVYMRGDHYKGGSAGGVENRNAVEAATIYTAASEIYMRIDKAEGLRALRSAITIYCDIGRFDIAGRLERRIADLHYMNKHFEEASAHYEKAANFLAGEQMFEQADICLETAATCCVEMKEYVDAQRLYELIAKSASQSNLRKFNARDYLFRAVLCSFAVHVRHPKTRNGEVDVDRSPDYVSKYEKVQQKLYFYETIDGFFRGSTEQRFLLNIYRERLDWNLDLLADHIYWWNNVRPLDRWCLLMLKVVVDEVKDEQKRLELLAKRQQEKEDRKKKKKEAKKMAKMLEQMVTGAPSSQNLEDDLRKISASTDDSSASGGSGADPHGIIDSFDSGDENEAGGYSGDEGEHREEKKEEDENMLFEGDGEDEDDY
jgi:tetratricopeptide (TPR) repeat protein